MTSGIISASTSISIASIISFVNLRVVRGDSSLDSEFVFSAVSDIHLG